jgi:hypothetical protein
MQAQKGLNAQLVQAINATGKFVATQKDVATSTSSFTQALEKNQMSMRQYFRYTAAAATQNTKVFKGMFAQERETLTRASKDRVKLLQSQYIQLQAANGNMIKTLQVIPKHLKMVNGQYTDYATRMQMAAQRQQFLNKLLSQGSTQLLNFGKNTQWAGRQLMVGLTIPLSILGSTAAKTFMEMEQAVTKFSRVYGDMTTGNDATNKAIADIQLLAKEFTKYGIAVKDTVEMAATAAAMGLTGGALNAQVIQATRLAVLGQVEQQQALETTISLTNAFGIASEDLAKKINFLNAVENQTVLSIEDLTIAVPKAGPVIKQLGGSVEDLAFFMTAMKEGGINASEGANALKSGLASMINPSKKASEFLAELGINITGIVNANAGDLKGTVVGFARALDTLDPLNRARAIEQMFGKFQFARLSTLFQNITKDGSQASRALGLAGASVEELAILSERELGKVEDMTGAKFKKSMENLKLQLIPIGKAFLQAVTPIVNFVGRILEKFNTLSDGTKKVVTVIIGVIGGLAPVALMTFGVLMNAVANGIKLFAKLRGGIAQLNGSNNVLGGGFEYLTNEQIENVAQANALHTSHSQLISTFNVEAASVQALAAAYGTAASQARALAQSSPGLFNTVPGPAGAVAGLPKYADGKKSDVITVGGTGNQDSELALLTPGETVISAPMSKKYGSLINAMIDDKVAGYAKSKKAPIVQEHVGRSTGGYANTSNVGPAALMAMGNQSEAEIDFTWLAKTENAGGEASDSVLAFSSQMKSLLLRGEHNGEVTEAAYQELNKSWPGLTDIVDEIGGVYRSGLTETKTIVDETTGAKVEVTTLKTSLTNVAQYSKGQFDLVISHIDQMERDLRISAEEAAQLRIAARRLIQPDVGTPANPGPDASERDIARTETGINSDGQEVVTGIKLERTPVPGGVTTLKESAQKAIGWEARHRGQSVPESSTLTAKEFKERNFETSGKDYPQFAHLSKGEKGVVWDEPQMSIRAQKGQKVPSPGEMALPDLIRAAKDDPTKRVRQGQVIAAPTVEVTPEDTAAAEAAGAEVGQAVIDGAEGPNGVDKGSPSKKGRKIGKSVADGIVEGLQEGTPEVTAQSSRLGDAAVPTAAETRAKVDKMDLDNKSFYDDIDTPEFRDQRQILKSQDRHRRKMGATGTVGGGPGTPPVLGPSSLTIASTAKTEAAAEQLAVSTEQAATAQSQVVQQIHDESKSRVTIKGNTINIGKARQEADRLDKEASDAEAAAARVRTEAAKWEEVAAREGGKNMHTAENAKALKKLADEAEIRAAEARIKAADAATAAANLEADEGSEQIIQDPVKTPAKVKKAEEIMSNGTVEAGDGMRRIVDGTDDTADSTLLVAEQTDELAATTGDIIPAQTENLDNVITTASLNDAIVQTTGDIHGSTIETAMSQEEIIALQEQEQVLREQLNANLKRQSDALLAGSDLSPTGKKRLTEQQALDEAFGRDPGKNGPDDLGQKGYTRNKKGEILFDPETGQPTTMDQKQITKKKRGMRKEKVGKFSGKAAGALGMATMVAGAVGAPPQVTAALGGAATVAQFAPMIAGMGPVGIAVAAIAAVGVGLMVLNKRLQASYDAQAKFVRETSASTKKMAEIGAITGKVGASEIMAKKRASGTTRDYIVRERAGSSFGDTFMQSDTGKAMSKTLQANITKSGAKEAAETFATEIAAYVQDGVLTAEQAQDIAYQIGVNFKDTSLGIKVDANLSALIGPNGEDLAKDPMVIGMRLVASAEKGSLNAVKSIDEAKSNGLSGAVEAAELGARDAVAMQMAQMQADAVAKRYDDEIRALETQIAQTKNKEQQIKLEDKLSALKEKANDSASQMNNLVANQTDMALQRFTEEIQHQSVVWDAVTLGLYKLWGAGNQREAAYTQALNGAITDKYANTEQATEAATVSDRLAKFADGKTLGFGTNNYEDAGFTGGGKEAQQFEVKMKLLMANGTLTPNQTTAMLDLFEGNLPRLEALLDIGTRMHGASGTAEFMMLLTNFQDKEYAQSIALEVVTQDNDSFKKLSDIFGLAAQLDGKEINMEVVIKEVGGVAGLDYYIERLDELETKIKGLKGKPIKQEDVAQFTKDTNVKVDDGFLDYVNTEFKGDGKKQADAIRAYTLIYKQIMSMDYASEEAREYFRSQAGQMAVDKLNELRKAGTAPADIETYIKQQTEIEIDALITKVRVDPTAVAGTKTETYLGTKPVVTSNTGPGGNKGGGGDKEDPLAFLESLAMRIKMVRDQAFNAKKPIESMLAAFNSPAAKKNVSEMFKLFDGVQQKLIALKVPEEFRDYIGGLDAKQFDELLKADLNLKKAGQQGVFTFSEKKDKNGKTVKDKKGNIVYDRSRITGISAEGKAIIAAYNEAPLDDFNTAQKKIILDTDNQFKAFNKLKAAGVETSVALEMVADTALAGAIASKQYDATEIKKFADDLKKSADAAEKAAVMSDLLKKNADFKFRQETFPKLASALKIAGMSAENIATVLQDPALAKQLMKDLEDGKIDSEAIAEYLNSIKEEKVLEIRTKFNAGDFAGAAAPGMELVNKMFAVQEQLIRTGVSDASRDMVNNVKALKDVNDKYQLEIQRINLERIKPIEDEIQKATRDLELKITRPLEVFQEEISDLQRNIELAFERPIAKINAENTILSEDMNIMNHAAEEINKRYDEQAEALSKVSEIKSQILEQEKEQLDLADALSKGDIGAAARAIQSIRAAQAARNAENASKALELSRKNKIDNLKGSVSGLTKEEITERQYENAKETYRLENTATTEVNGLLMTRLDILDSIQKKSDEIYKLEEKREAAQILIRNKEDEIYNIKNDESEGGMKFLEDTIDKNNYLIARDEYAIDQLVKNTTVLGKTKDTWDGISAQIEASALAASDFDGLMGTMLASTDKIQAGWEKIGETLKKYSDITGAKPGTLGLGTPAMEKARTDTLALGDKWDAEAIADKQKLADAQLKYETEKKQYDSEVDDLKKQLAAALARNDFYVAGMIQQALAAKVKAGPPVAPVTKPSRAADNPNADYNDLTINSATDMFNSTKPVAGTTTSSAGGSSSTGGATNTVPGPGTTKPPVVVPPAITGVTGTSSTGTSTVSGVSEDKVFSTSSIEKITGKANNALLAASSEGLTAAAAKNFTDMRNIQLKIDKDYPGYFDATEHISMAATSSVESDQMRYEKMLATVTDYTKKAALKVELDKIMKLKEEQRKYYYGKDKTGKTVYVGTTSATVDSEKKKAAMFAASQAIPAQAKELLDMLKNRNQLFKTDKAEFDKNKTAYTALAKSNGFPNIDKIDFRALKKADPKTHDLLLPLSQAYAKSKSTMEWRELAMNKARTLLENAGYTKAKMSWYFSGDANAMTRTSNASDYSKWTGYATGGLVSSNFAQNKFKMGTDTVPAMLTPGEFVMNKFAVQSHGIGKMQAMNNGQAAGDSVYNYSISVNVKSESNPDEIARTVIAQIKSVDAQKMRGVRT